MSTAIALDLGNGQQRRSRAMVSEHDGGPLAGPLEPLVKAFGVEVIVTDELATYNLVAQAAASGRAGSLPGAASGGYGG
jgi:hypothetical protein